MKETELNSILNANFGKQRWVDQISKNFKEEAGIDVRNIHVCIFNVPKSISRFKPEDYVPQAIALGPYHHFETHLYQMERYKVAAVKALLNLDQVHTFEPLVIMRLKKVEFMIRACYHKYLDLDGDTLAWILAIDGLFLLDLFMHYKEIDEFIPKKLMNHAILYRDIMVLENQIPLVILKEIQKITNGDLDLLSIMIGFCEVHSPLKLCRDLNYSIGTAGYLHLLDLMYHLIVNNESPKEASHRGLFHGERTNGVQEITPEHHVIDNMDHIMELGQRLGKIRRVGKAISVLVSIPWDKISELLGFQIGKKIDKEDGNHPRVTEIEIPSVTSLSKYGRINFNPTNGGIRDTRFVATEATLYLPVITLETYSEVVLRNLVAYEVATSSSTMELARYVDLMSGIIDKEEDVKLLKGKGIIEGNMTNAEIVDFFNGMNKSNEHAKGNKTVEQLNEYYNKILAIKAWKFLKKRMRGSRKVLTIVFTLLACLLMIVYSFCEVYGCPKLFNKIT